MSTNLKMIIAQELKVMGESFIRISEAFAMEEETKTPIVEVQQTETSKVVESSKEETQPVVEDKVEEEATNEQEQSHGQYSEEQLNKMTYNDVRKLAKEIGVTATGAKATIIERILEADGMLSEDKEPKKEPVEETPVQQEPVKEEPTNEVEETETEVEEEDVNDEDIPVDDAEMDEETISTRIEEELKDYSLEEIADILESVGISPKGKRQALIAKVVKAVEEGLLSLDDEEGEETSETPQQEEPVQEEKVQDEPQDDEEQQSEGDFLLECNTNVRLKAIRDISKEIDEALEKGEFSDKEINEYLADFYLPHEGFKKTLPKDEKIDMFKELYARMIDDEGIQHDFQDPYYINDEPVCCGHLLNYDEDNKEYVCSVCANKYSAE